MSAAKHTPGPWTASAPDGSYHDVIRIWADDIDDRPVAICPQMEGPALAVMTGQRDDTTQAAANARLISAAPDMHEALDDLSGLLRRGWTLADDIEVSRALDRAEAALKKARGE